MTDELTTNFSTDETPEEVMLQCDVNITDSGPWKKKIAITIPRTEIDKRLEEKYSELTKDSQVPGFRKGRAPRRLIEKRFGEEVGDQIKLSLMADALKQIEDGQDFELLGEPDFDPAKIELPDTGDFSFDYEVEVKPTFELPSLEGLRIEKPMFEVTDERIEESLGEMLNRYGTTESITDESAKEDDVVMARATLKIEGVEEPLTDEEFPVRVGPAGVLGVWFENMGKTLKGSKPGETKTVATTIPDDHHEEAWRGKKAEATLAVKSIRRRIPAKLNQAFFDRLGVADEAELRTRIGENLEDQADREIRNVMRNQVYAHLDKAVSFELPAGVATRHAGRVLARQYYDLLRQGVSQEMIETHLEELRSRSTAQAAGELKMSFIMDAVADKLEIKVADGELNNYIAQMAAMQGRRPERLRDEMSRQGRLEDLRDRIRDDRAIDKILEMAEVVDAPEPNAGEKPAKKTDKKADKKSAKEEKPAETDDDATAAGKKPAGRKQVKRKPPSADKNED